LVKNSDRSNCQRFNISISVGSSYFNFLSTQSIITVFSNARFCNHSLARCQSLAQAIHAAVDSAATHSNDNHPLNGDAITATAHHIAHTNLSQFSLNRLAHNSVKVPFEETFFELVINFTNSSIDHQSFIPLIKKSTAFRDC